MASPRRPVRVSIAVGLAVLGVALVWAAQARPSITDSVLPSASDGPEASSTSSPMTEPGTPEGPAAGDQIDVRDRIRGPVLPESDPVVVSISRIGVSSRIVELGVDNKSGEMEVPQDADRAGWFTRAAAPGSLGPAIIAGHVTWDGGPAVFHRLGTLRRGDQVTVTRKDGRTAVFTVTGVARFAKSRFPTRAVYGAIDHAGLRLITCGGTYDAARKRYLDNVVVFAKLSRVRGPNG